MQCRDRQGPGRINKICLIQAIEIIALICKRRYKKNKIDFIETDIYSTLFVLH